MGAYYSETSFTGSKKAVFPTPKSIIVVYLAYNLPEKIFGEVGKCLVRCRIAWYG